MDRARSLLDELLGPERDKISCAGWDSLRYKDVCVFMLAGLCPYQKLSEAKIHVGTCPFKRHEKYFVRLYESYRHPEIAEKERNLMVLLAEMYVDNYRRVARRRAEVEAMSRRSGDPRMAAWRVEKDELACEMENMLAGDRLGEARACFESIKFITRSMEDYLNAGLKVCKDCGKDFDEKSQPPGYWSMHVKSKFHQSFVSIRDKLAELMAKHGEIKGQIPRQVAHVLGERAR